MAASVNNIAATFATVPLSSSSASPSSSSHSSATATPSNHSNFSLSLTCKPIITWNPHLTLPKSRRSSFLSIYGPPGPPRPPFHSIPTTCRLPKPEPLQFPLIGRNLPAVALSYLDRRGKVQSVTASSLGKGRKLAVVGASAAFSGRCGRYLRRAEAARGREVDLIACVAASDVLVMRAWGKDLDVGEKVVMLSDARGDLSRELGLCSGTPMQGVGGGFGEAARSRRFCLSAINGVITNVSVDDDEDDAEDGGGEIEFVSRKVHASLKIK